MTEEVHKLLLSPRRGGRVTRAGPPLLPIERLAGLQERKAPAVSGAARGPEETTSSDHSELGCLLWVIRGQNQPYFLEKHFLTWNLILGEDKGAEGSRSEATGRQRKGAELPVGSNSPWPQGPSSRTGVGL